MLAAIVMTESQVCTITTFDGFLHRTARVSDFLASSTVRQNPSDDVAAILDMRHQECEICPPSSHPPLHHCASLRDNIVANIVFPPNLSSLES